MTIEGATASWATRGAPLCVMRCMHESALTVDGEPYCIDCADEWLDRLQAVELRPELREILPPLTPKGEDFETVRRRIANRIPANVSSDSDQLRALGKAWASSPWNPANDPGRAGRPSSAMAPKRHRSGPRVGVTPGEPHRPERDEPAGQLSLLAESS